MFITDYSKRVFLNLVDKKKKYSNTNHFKQIGNSTYFFFLSVYAIAKLLLDLVDLIT